MSGRDEEMPRRNEEDGIWGQLCELKYFVEILVHFGSAEQYHLRF